MAEIRNVVSRVSGDVSGSQEAIHQHIDIVIGMKQAIGDRAAIKFAEGFYDALGAGRSYEDAYEFGCSAIDLENIPEYLTPVLKTRKPPSQSVETEALLNEIATSSKTAGISSAHNIKVFISYHSKEPDQSLAEKFQKALQAAGYQAFMAAASIRLGENWPQRIDNELQTCDYFLLLLSAKSATSEMVTEEVRRARELQDIRLEHKPVILPIRVNFPLDSPLNYDLRSYLNQIQQREWRSPDDTPLILREILQLLATGKAPKPLEVEEERIVPLQDSPDYPPLPVAEPELRREPGGIVPLTSGLYIERPPIEEDCYEEILQPGALIRIKAPRQMGKTSLMARILNYASSQGYYTVPISLQRADSSLFTDLNLLLRWLCTQMAHRLNRHNHLDDYWTMAEYGVKDRCITYFEECLLAHIDSPLVLALDEVDLIFPHQEVADDFFGLLRSAYEAARYGDVTSELWEKLRLVIVHSTEAYIPLNINQSPFNVGKTVELPEFTLHQVQDLAQRYGLIWSEDSVKELMGLVGGHPYLIRKAFYHLRRQELTLAQLLETGATEAGVYGDHLRRHLLNLQRYPELVGALRQVVTHDSVDLEATIAFKLNSIGVTHLRGNQALVRCNLYRQYFRDHLKS